MLFYHIFSIKSSEIREKQIIFFIYMSLTLRLFGAKIVEKSILFKGESRGRIKKRYRN